MKALVKKYPKPGLWLDEVPVPGIGINDVFGESGKPEELSGIIFLTLMISKIPSSTTK